MSDYRLAILAIIFCTLSFTMCWIIRRLPLLCQLFWPIISVWGILWVHVGVYILYPEARPMFWIYVWVFIFALPGMIALHYRQAKDLIYLFKLFKITKATSGIRVFLKEDELENTGSTSNQRNSNPGNSDFAIPLARVLGRRYRRRNRV